jgi:DNA invertase Pin-like site-specific DNA recombinase
MESTDELDHVVVHEVSRLARSIADFDRTVEQLHDAGTSVHIVSEGLHLPADDTDPYSRALAQLLGVFAELDAAIIRDRVQQGLDIRLSDPEYHHGPAPLGFDKDDGRLVPTHEYPAVCRVLAAVESDDMSVSAAADTLDTSRKTIHRALQHPERYELDDDESSDDPEHPHGWVLPP